MVTRSKTSQKELYFVSSYGVTLVSRLRRDSTTMSRPLARGDLDYRNRFHWQNSGMKDSYPELLIEYPQKDSKVVRKRMKAVGSLDLPSRQ